MVLAQRLVRTRCAGRCTVEEALRVSVATDEAGA
jgi:hypothetical protein